MKVKEAMHSGVTWVSPNTLVSELAKKMRDGDIGAILGDVSHRVPATLVGEMVQAVSAHHG